jgi:tetratricopeptide (TPR) repeat protein
VVLAACPSGRPSPEAPPEPEAALGGVPRAERPFIVDPLEGYPLVPVPDPAARVRAGWRALVRTGDAAAARALAAELLEDDPGFHPARVLAAQGDFLAGDDQAALDGLGPVVEELPGYTAAQLLRGRAAEGLGRIPEAYAAFRAVAEASGAAADRAEVLRERAVEIVANRFQDSLGRGRLEDAAGQLGRLERWAPDAEATLEASRSLAAARGDRRAELAAVGRLLERFPERRELQVRRAELELAVGDASEGLQILQRLADRNPGDRELREKLEQAKFVWRLTLLPAHVQEVSRSPELTRADFATLVHWLVPRVRTSRAPAGRIAGDILEHPRREEIARIVNLGLMDVDPTLHTFSPERPIRRATAIAALLRAVETLGGPAACLPRSVADSLGRSPTAETVCGAAARCGLLPSEADCLPGATLSGAQALELLRHALQLFSAPPG